MAPKKKEKEIRISVRITPQLKAELQKAVELTGIDESTLVRKCLEALLDHVETHGSITLPLSIGPKQGAGWPAPAQEIVRFEEGKNQAAPGPRAKY